MRKIFILILFFCSLALQAQTPLKTRQLVADSIRIKNLTARPVEIAGYGTFYGMNDSLWFTDAGGNDYNLLRWLDSAAAHRIILDQHTEDILAIFDSLNQHRFIIDSHTSTLVGHTALLGNLQDSIDKHTDTLQVHRADINSKEDTISQGAASRFYSWDKTWRDVDWDYITGKPSEASIFKLDSAYRIHALYPLQIASLSLLPDSRYIPLNVPVVNAPAGDTVSVGIIIGPTQVMLAYGVSDGAGGLRSYGVKVQGNIDATGNITGANINAAHWDSAYSKRVETFADGTRKTGTTVKAYEPEINHDSLQNYIAQKHFYQKNIDTVKTSLSGILKAVSGVLSAAAAGTDYIAPYSSQSANYFLAAPNGSSGTPSFRAIVAADIPTLNQNTTGSAAKWTTARLLAGNSVDGSANVAFTNKFIVQGTSDSGLSGAQFLGSLSTGILKNTTSTGVMSIATAGIDYQAPLSAGQLANLNTISAWRRDADSTISALYPVNISAFRLPPDARYNIWDLPIYSAPNGDTVAVGGTVAGKRSWMSYGVSDGTGAAKTYGHIFRGDLLADSLASANIKYGQKLRLANQDYFSASFDSTDNVRGATMKAILDFGNSKWGSGSGSGEINTASNLGTGEGVFKSKVSYDLQFKSLRAQSPLTVSSANDTISFAISAATTSSRGTMSAADKTKLDGIASGANNYTHPNHSGDVTSSGDGATTIANSAVTLAKMANMATASLIYRKTSGTGAPEVNTLATLKTDLGLSGTNTGDDAVNARYSGLADAWGIGPDSTTYAKYPAAISSFLTYPDSRYTLASLPVYNAITGDTVDFNLVIGGERVFQAFGVSGGAGRTKARGMNILGNVYSNGLYSTDSVAGISGRLKDLTMITYGASTYPAIRFKKTGYGWTNDLIWGIIGDYPGNGSGDLAFYDYANGRVSLALKGLGGDLEVYGQLKAGTVNHATTDLDKFVVDSAGFMKYRTGAELLNDIGGTLVESDPIVKAINGIVKSNGSTISAATAGSDYSAGTASLTTGLLKSTTSTGALSIASGSDIHSTFGSQSANLVYASPNGSAGNPSFRSLVASDIPALPYDNYYRWMFGYVNETGGGGTDYIYSGTVLKFQAEKPLSAQRTGSGTAGDPYILKFGWGTGQAYLNYAATAPALIAGSGRSTDGLICGNLTSGTYNLLSLDYGGTNKIRIDNAGNGFFAGYVSVANEAYGSGWNGSTEAPTKDAVYDKIEAITTSDRYIKTITIDNATLTSLYSTPLKIIDAPGAGKAINIDYVESVWIYNKSGAGLTNVFISYLYPDGLTYDQDHQATIPTFDGTVDKNSGQMAMGYNKRVKENTAIYLRTHTNPTGEGSMKLYLSYRIITL